MIYQKRMEHKITLRKFASEIGKSPTFVSCLESNMQTPTSNLTEKIIEVLQFDTADTDMFHSLVADLKQAHKNQIDANAELVGDKPVIIALRVSKELAKEDKEWADFVKKLNKERALGGFA